MSILLNPNCSDIVARADAKTDSEKIMVVKDIFKIFPCKVYLEAYGKILEEEKDKKGIIHLKLYRIEPNNWLMSKEAQEALKKAGLVTYGSSRSNYEETIQFRPEFKEIEAATQILKKIAEKYNYNLSSTIQGIVPGLKFSHTEKSIDYPDYPEGPTFITIKVEVSPDLLKIEDGKFVFDSKVFDVVYKNLEVKLQVYKNKKWGELETSKKIYKKAKIEPYTFTEYDGRPRIYLDGKMIVGSDIDTYLEGITLMTGDYDYEEFPIFKKLLKSELQRKYKFTMEGYDGGGVSKGFGPWCRTNFIEFLIQKERYGCNYDVGSVFISNAKNLEEFKKILSSFYKLGFEIRAPLAKGGKRCSSVINPKDIEKVEIGGTVDFWISGEKINSNYLFIEPKDSEITDTPNSKYIMMSAFDELEGASFDTRRYYFFVDTTAINRYQYKSMIENPNCQKLIKFIEENSDEKIENGKRIELK